MNNTWITVIGGLVAALIAAQVTWAARQLIKHAEILAKVTTTLDAHIVVDDQAHEEIRVIGRQVTDVRIEQARVKAELARRPI